jgi:hypothetical protein
MGRPHELAGRGLKRAGVQKITPHDLRHTCASLAVSAGVNVLALQRMLGHTSAAMTLDTYSDLFDDDLDAVAVTLHSRYSRSSVGKSVGTRPQRQQLANIEIASASGDEIEETVRAEGLEPYSATRPGHRNRALAAETHNSTSRQLSVTDAKVCPICAHGALLFGCFAAPPRQGGTRPT